MIGQISASNQLQTNPEPVRSQLRTSSELAPNMFGASSEPASVMEFGFYTASQFYRVQGKRQRKPYYFARGSGCEVCDEYVCVSVCLSVCPWGYLRNQWTTRAIFTKLCTCCLCPRFGPSPATSR